MDTEWIAFLLREPALYASDAAALRAEVHAASEWIRAITETAQQMNVPRGQLCRQILPFSEETDAKDQANVAPGACPLREGAVRTRKFLRLKISDENDLRQATDALLMVEGCFFKN